MEKITAKYFAEITDLACVKADSSIDEIRNMALAANKWGFAGIYALTSHNEMLKNLLTENTKTFLGGVVGFPSGGVSTATKVYETRELIRQGCGEIDMVINIAWLKAGMTDLFRQDIKQVVEAAEGKIVKAIIEVHYLSNDEIMTASRIAADCGAAFIKTATGWAESGASLDRIRLIQKAISGTGCQIKAAGGIRDLETIKAMIELGVTRFGFGTETALKIINEIE